MVLKYSIISPPISGRFLLARRGLCAMSKFFFSRGLAGFDKPIGLLVVRLVVCSSGCSVGCSFCFESIESFRLAVTVFYEYFTLFFLFFLFFFRYFFFSSVSSFTLFPSFVFFPPIFCPFRFFPFPPFHFLFCHFLPFVAIFCRFYFIFRHFSSYVKKKTGPRVSISGTPGPAPWDANQDLHLHRELARSGP